MSQVELHHGAATDVGLVRESNEDAFLVAPPVFAVADGMGGHEGGEVASAIVVEELGRLASAGYDRRRAADELAAVLTQCQRRILEYAGQQRATGLVDRATAGTTAVVALLAEDDEGPHWVVANLGDSRAYRFGADGLAQVSVDHNLAQQLRDSGAISPAEAAHHPDRHVLTRALGDPDGAEADYFRLPLGSAERLLLCSDGVSGMIDDARIADILGAADDPRDAADRLVGAAVAAGGEDNATAVVVDVVGLVADDAYDAEQQRGSLEEKLGAQP